MDFACPARKLAIEIDGGQHAVRQPQDAARTTAIIYRGYRVVRLWNGDIVGNLAGVLETIRRELTQNGTDVTE